MLVILNGLEVVERVVLIYLLEEASNCLVERHGPVS
jgi:hypothetical protein